MMGKKDNLERLNPQCCKCRLKAMELIHKQAVHVGARCGTQTNYTHIVTTWQDWFDRKPPENCRCK